MNRLMIPLCTVLSVLAASALCAEPQLTAGPAVSRKGAGVEITFTVSEPTDVEVAVLARDGRVVRHLAAGAVGAEAAAAPLQPKRLEQSVLWDRRDDGGQPAVDGPYRVRVRLGMRVRFGRTLGADPYLVEAPRSLACDARGNVYLMSQSYRVGDGKSAGPKYIQMFDRDGKYVRTLMPYSNRLPKDRAAGFGLIETDGLLTPRNYEGVWPWIYPHPDVLLLPVVGRSGRIDLYNSEWLFQMDSAGGAVDGFRGVALWPEDKPQFHYNRSGPLCLAMGPKCRRLYVAGPYVSPKKANDAMKAAWPKGRVYALDLDTGGGAKPFADVPITQDRDLDVPAAMKRMRRAPHGPVHGLAVGPKGYVYVCDRANDLVRVYAPDGKLLRSIPVRQPHLVAVHPGTGAVCVVTVRPVAYRTFDTRLVVFRAGTKKPVAEMELPEGAGRPVLALDPTSPHVALWLTAVQGNGVWRVELLDDKLKLVRKLPLKSGGALWGADRITVDYETDDIYVNDGWSSLARYNGLTGEGGTVADARALTGVWERDTNQRTNRSATDAAVGPDGLVYLRNGPRYSGPITRWGRGLKPAPLPETSSHVFTRYIYSRYGAGYGERGLDVHPDGRVFVMSMYHWARYFVHVFGPDGAPLNSGRLDDEVRAYRERGARITSGLIGPLTGRCGGLEVDRPGHVYLGMQLLPEGFEPPDGFEKDPAYRRLTGSVFKFRPTGGGLTSGKGKTSGPDGIKIGGRFAEGAVAVYPGFAPFSGGYGSQCACRNPRFDLDPYGRLYIPNAVRFSVAILDNAGNLILRFGRYGNPDDPGKGADIPLGWPIGAGVSEKHIYTSDMLNKRVVRADVRYAVTAEQSVPAAARPRLPGGTDELIARLGDGDPAVEAAAARTLRQKGRGAVAALEKAFARERVNRRAIRDVVAWIRLDRAVELFGLAVSKRDPVDQAALERRTHRALVRRSGLPSLEDACVQFAYLTRVVPGWDASAGAERYFYGAASPRVRMSALWAVHRPDVPGTKDAAIRLGSAGLKDDDEHVRMLAATMLFDIGESQGLRHIFRGALSKDRWVLDLARPYVQESIVMKRGPHALRYPVGPGEVDLALKLLHDEHNNMRAMAAPILMYSGDARAAKALAERLAKETIGFVRRRIMLALEHLRSRDATPALLADVAGGPGPRRKGTGWRAAGCLADTGDPAAVVPLIALLDRTEARPLALFALSRMFDASVTTASDFRLIPDENGKLIRHSIHKLPPYPEIKKAWAAFWAANRAKYKWTEGRHPFRPSARDATK
jgi:hypothetical protein